VIQLTGGGNDQTTSADAAGRDWLATRLQIVAGKTVLDVNGKQRTFPRADLSALL
jgi:hypothetical protein